MSDLPPALQAPAATVLAATVWKTVQYLRKSRWPCANIWSPALRHGVGAPGCRPGRTRKAGADG